ncbi:VOC family protein [Amycolatopsis minnesotensis]|uniref:VOC domain-containing protein n=1 Tax=Amycolatopsis minnesotensis TaxID=337894 RepID=A0ABN2QPX5_9PSEU
MSLVPATQPDGTPTWLRGQPVAGSPEGAGWLMYFASTDCDAAAKRATEAGGTVISADYGDQGCAALLNDPSGAVFGLWGGHEIGGIFGDPTATESVWMTTFEVADADSVARAAVEAGGSAGPAEDNPSCAGSARWGAGGHAMVALRGG